MTLVVVDDMSSMLRAAACTRSSQAGAAGVSSSDLTANSQKQAARGLSLTRLPGARH
jgi:hypothetical protein